MQADVALESVEYTSRGPRTTPTKARVRGVVGVVRDDDLDVGDRLTLGRCRVPPSGTRLLLYVGMATVTQRHD